MGRRSSILLCLAFSGLSALVYQVIWTRLLGFAFGTTTEAIATVLAVFFAGLALGNFAAGWRDYMRRPRRSIRGPRLASLHTAQQRIDRRPSPVPATDSVQGGLEDQWTRGLMAARQQRD